MVLESKEQEKNRNTLKQKECKCACLRRNYPYLALLSKVALEFHSLLAFVLFSMLGNLPSEALLARVVFGCLSSRGRDTSSQCNMLPKSTTYSKIPVLGAKCDEKDLRYLVLSVFDACAKVHSFRTLFA